MTVQRVSVLSCCAVALVLVALTGCEDPDAARSASDAGKKVDQVRGRLDALDKKVDDTAASIKAAEERLMKHIDERSDAMMALLKGNQELSLKQIDSGITKNLSDSTGLAKSSREEYERDLAAQKASMAEEVQKLRGELKASVDELRKFMDNQLKETYPYAFQPKRMEPAAPPANPEVK